MSHQIKLHHVVSTEHPKWLLAVQHPSSEHGLGAPVHLSTSASTCDCPPDYVCWGTYTLVPHGPPLLVAFGITAIVAFAVGYFLGKRAAQRRQNTR